MSLSGLTYTCQDCRKVSIIKNTFNRLGLPSYCKDCMKKQDVEIARGVVDEYQSVLQKHSEDLDHINKLYHTAAKLLGIDIVLLESKHHTYVEAIPKEELSKKGAKNV